MMLNYLAKFLISLLLLSGCKTSTQADVKPFVAIFTQNIMTIDYHILIGHPLNLIERQRIQSIIDQTFAEVDVIYNKWNPSSEISKLNRLKTGESIRLSDSLFQFLTQLSELVALTNGRFDPTIEPLQQLWKSKLEKGLIPSAEELSSIKPCLGWDKIHFEDGFFIKDDNRTQLDFGGVAKGLCVDLLVERLNQAGFENVFVEWGGEIRASGIHPSRRPWNIYISHLDDPNPAHALAYVSLINQAIATSGDYFQYWTITTEDGNEKMYCHIFDPHTLSPVLVQPGSVASASLIADNCLTADSLAKVLMLFESKEKAEEWIENLRQTHPRLQFWMAIH
jgi:thiamine biosynthesis lipoprotein